VVPNPISPARVLHDEIAEPDPSSLAQLGASVTSGVVHRQQYWPAGQHVPVPVTGLMQRTVPRHDRQRPELHTQFPFPCLIWHWLVASHGLPAWASVTRDMTVAVVMELTRSPRTTRRRLVPLPSTFAIRSNCSASTLGPPYIDGPEGTRPPANGTTPSAGRAGSAIAAQAIRSSGAPDALPSEAFAAWSSEVECLLGAIVPLVRKDRRRRPSLNW
jgi:hypothetical protein